MKWIENPKEIMLQVTELANSNFTKGWGGADDYGTGSEEYKTMLQAMKRYKQRIERILAEVPDKYK